MIVSFHLDRIAKRWFAWMEASNLLSSWKKFVDSILRKFTSLYYSLLGGKLSKLCKDGTMSEYQSNFEEMCTKVLGLPDYFILEMCILGLREDIQVEVLLDKSKDI